MRFLLPLLFLAGLQAAPTLVWQEEFSQAENSGPDKARWVHDLGASGWGNKELQRYTDGRENSFVVADVAASDGKAFAFRALKLADGTYTSARIKTAGLYFAKYGRIEARIRLPKGKGIWPAFWMVGKASHPGERWPEIGEIDIMEYLGDRPTKAYGTLHGPGYSGDQGLQGVYTLPNKEVFEAGYHVFSVEWREDRIDWFVDGTLYHTRTPATLPAGTRWVFNRPFFIILNLAVGGVWPGYPDASTEFPQTMYVDYVRVYTLQPGDFTAKP